MTSPLNSSLSGIKMTSAAANLVRSDPGGVIISSVMKGVDVSLIPGICCVVIWLLSS